MTDFANESSGEASELRVLLVEDTDADAALVARALRSVGYRPIIRRVETEQSFRAALESEACDLIISDHSLPQFSSVAALACLHDVGLDLPFIVVSGTIDEESAITILKAGAHDFVTKQNLARLGPAIRRELQEARNRAERRNAQHDLQVQRDFLRLVIDTIPSLIFVKDWEGRFRLANRATAELYGTTVDHLVGKTDADFHRASGDLEEFLRADRTVMATGQPRFAPGEPLTDARTGAIRWFETRMVPLVVPGRSPQVIGIGTEITERRLAEEALRKAEEQFRQAQKMEAVGQLAGGIAHDFNNLLTAILGYTDLASHGVRHDQRDLAADLEEIRRAGERAVTLTRQLLAFSRKQVLERQIVNLNDVVQELERMLRRLIGEDIQLETVTARPLHPVIVDPGQMEQVLLNLVINARDAMPGGGTLRIETANTTAPPEMAGSSPDAAAQPCISLTITDTGCGIPSEIRSRIFEPFFTTKDPGKGTGLGLAMVYGVVTQTGGCITVDSEPGRGTRFTIYLPAAEARSPTVAEASERALELKGSETILLVEDEHAIRELVRKVLAGYGYHVLEAADAAHALETAERHPGPIDLLISDIVMPRMSGPELAERLAARRPETRVLYMSGFSNRPISGFSSPGPRVMLLHKPFTPDRLARKVRECLNSAVMLSKGDWTG